uniref:Putative polyprotein n=1 Tax=Red panda feces-associated Iflaviridae TaxID=2864007 RepID=A0A8K1HHK2_9VIRU|nr:putative polyprotein [Red panda feces-associated Iflaviridae]
MNSQTQSNPTATLVQEFDKLACEDRRKLSSQIPSISYKGVPSALAVQRFCERCSSSFKFLLNLEEAEKILRDEFYCSHCEEETLQVYLDKQAFRHHLFMRDLSRGFTRYEINADFDCFYRTTPIRYDVLQLPRQQLIRTERAVIKHVKKRTAEKNLRKDSDRFETDIDEHFAQFPLTAEEKLDCRQIEAYYNTRPRIVMSRGLRSLCLIRAACQGEPCFVVAENVADLITRFFSGPISQYRNFYFDTYAMHVPFFGLSTWNYIVIHPALWDFIAIWAKTLNKSVFEFDPDVLVALLLKKSFDLESEKKVEVKRENKKKNIENEISAILKRIEGLETQKQNKNNALDNECASGQNNDSKIKELLSDINNIDCSINEKRAALYRKRHELSNFDFEEIKPAMNNEEPFANILQTRRIQLANTIKQLKYDSKKLLNLQDEIMKTFASIGSLGDSRHDLYLKKTRKVKCGKLNAQIVFYSDLLDLHRHKIDVLEKAIFALEEQDKIDLDELKPAMDNEGGEQLEAKNVFNETENTAIGSTAVENETILTSQTPETSFTKEIYTDQDHEYKDLTDRWLLLDQIQLTTSLVSNTVIKQWHLPADFVIRNWDNPNMLPFKQFNRFVCDMELDFQLNNNKQNQFAARAGTQYQWLPRDRRAELINLWSLSQQPGMSLNSPKKNSDKLSVPYFSHLPVMQIRDIQESLNMYYATVSLMSYTDFQVATGGTTTATLNVYARFKNIRFFGMSPFNNVLPTFVVPAIESIVEEDEIVPAMFTAAASVVAKSVVSAANSVVSGTVSKATKAITNGVESKISQGKPNTKSNRDKPTNHTNSVFHQRAVCNVASGSGDFVADSLRLEQVGSTPHPEFLVGVEKYSDFSNIIETYGFINRVRIPVSGTAGLHLASFSAMPGIFNPNPFGGVYANNISIWTPVDHIAGWFLNYQGRLEYKFEFVVDGFKTFRVRVAYDPRPGNATTIAFAESESLYYETFDVGSQLDTESQFTFETPYFSTSLQTQIRSPENAVVSNAGKIYVFLEIPINAPPNVVPFVDMLVFKRAKPGDFVFSVPRPNTSAIKITSGDIPVLPDPQPPPINWNRTQIRATFTAFVWNVIGNLSYTLRVEGYNSVITINKTATGPHPTVTSVSPGGRQRDAVNTDRVSEVGGSMVFSIFHFVVGGNLDNIRFQFSWPGQTFGASVFTITPEQALFSLNNASSIPLLPLEYSGSAVVPTVTFDGSLDSIAPAMDVREESANSANLVPNFSIINESMIGENHMSLITNLRRFERWHNLTTSVSSDSLISQVRIFSIPLNLGFPTYRSNVSYAYRNNKICHMHDAFRFARGSLRKILKVAASANGILTIQHVPQVSNYPLNVANQLTQIENLSNGYAETIVSLQQNNITPVEIPMYSPLNSVMTASYNSNTGSLNRIAQGLGVLNIFWSGPSAVISIDIMRAVGDDFGFYCFNGFPLRDVATTGFEVIGYNSNDTSPKDDLMPAVHIENRNIEDSINTASESFVRLTDNMSDFLNRMGGVNSPGSLTSTLLIQVLHMFNNPSISTFALVVAQIFVSAGLFTIDLFVKFERAVTDAFSSLISLFPANVNHDISELASLGSTIFCAVSSFFGSAVDKVPKNFIDKISFAATKGAQLNFRLVSYLEGILNFTKKAALFVLSKICPKSSWVSYLKGENVTEWITRVNIFTDTTNWHKINGNPLAIQVLYRLVRQGELMLDGLSSLSRSGTAFQHVSRALVDLKKVRDKHGVQAHVPKVKYDPYCFYIFSEDSQIGKSHLLKELCRKLVDYLQIKIQNRSNMFFVVPEADKFWEGYSSQEVIIFDDFMRIADHTESVDTDAARLCGLKGASPFPVPMAFDSKGIHSICKLIACSSNKPYPVVNGINSNIIWSRRNCLWEVKADFSCYESCAYHKTKTPSFSMGCADCVILNDNSKFEGSPHLSFLELDPERPGQAKSNNRVNYNLFLERLISNAFAYHVRNTQRYAKEVEAEKKFSKDNEWKNILIPEEVVNDYNNLVNEEMIERLRESFRTDVKYEIKSERVILHGDGVPAFSYNDESDEIRPSMFKSMCAKVANLWKSEENYLTDVDEEFQSAEEEDVWWGEYDCVHDFIIQNRVRPVSWKPIKWHVNGVFVYDKCCDGTCVWYDRRKAYWLDYGELLQKNGMRIPSGFPYIYNVQAQYEVESETVELGRALESDPWYKKYSNLLILLGTATAACGALSLFYNRQKTTNPVPTRDLLLNTHCSDIFTDTSLVAPTTGSSYGEATSLPNVETTEDINFVQRRWGLIDPSQKVLDLVPAIEASGDAKTKYAKKFSKVKYSVRNQRARAIKPAGLNEAEVVKKAYFDSLVEISAKGGNFTARCIEYSPKRYITQLHAICTVMTFITGKLKEIYDSKKFCSKLCVMDHNIKQIVHCRECVVRTNQEVPMLMKRRSKQGPLIEIEVRLSDFMTWNGGTIAVDADNSDMAGFFINRQEFSGTCIDKYVFTEEDGRIDLQNIRYFDPGTMSGKHPPFFRHIEGVMPIHEQHTYKSKFNKSWAPHCDVDIAVNIHGFKIANPIYGEFGNSCGSVLIDFTTGKIIGVMSAASKGALYFNMISVEQLDRGFGWFTSNLNTSFDAEGNIIRVSEFKGGHELLPLETKTATLGSELVPSMSLYHSTKTQIVPSLCHLEFGEVKRAPANLSQNGDRGQKALYGGLSDYIPHDDFPDHLVGDAFTDLRANFLRNCKPILPVESKTSIRTAIEGIPCHIPRITMSTSPGIPWCLNSKTKKKTDLITFDEDGNVYTINKNLLVLINKENEMMEAGGKPLTIFQLSHKDERLPLHKRDRVRIIQGSPLQYTISSRQYMAHFNYAFQVNRNELQHCVGINAESTEWDDLARRLLAKSDLICVGDYSKFGPRLNTKLVECSYMIIHDWYAEYATPTMEHQKARRQLGERAMNSLNMGYNDIIKVSCGSPSGAINTVIINSMCNMLYMRIAWMLIMDKHNPKLRGLHHFAELVEFYCYGDDVIFAIDESIKDIFNNETISAAFAQYNFKYTDVTKDDGMRKWCTLEEATFLKRGFKLFKQTSVPGGMWICLPDLGDVLDTTNWVRLPKSKNNPDRTVIDAAIENCEDCIRKSWFHGREQFEAIQEKIRIFFKERNLRQPRHYTYYGLQADYDIPLPYGMKAPDDIDDPERFQSCYCRSNPEQDGNVVSECFCKENATPMSQYGRVTVRRVDSSEFAFAPASSPTRCVTTVETGLAHEVHPSSPDVPTNIFVSENAAETASVTWVRAPQKVS